jgi:CDP-glucose 4,6-dehydratase
MVMKLGEGLKGLPGPILVTGHSGFKGSWLMMLLDYLRIPAVGFSLPAEPESLYLRANLVGKNKEYFGDIRNLSEVEKVFRMFAPSAVLHMAAQPLVLKSYENPLETFETNIMGTANVLKAALDSPGVKVIGVVTTDKVYRNNNSGISFQEDDALEGKDPYSASKVGTESVVSAWRNISEMNSGPQIISLRAGNVVGGGDFSPNRLVPDIVRAKISGVPLRVRNIQSTRPWQHVLDPLVGYLLALEKGVSGNAQNSYNFAPVEKSLTVGEVLEIAKEYYDNDFSWVVESSREVKSLESKFLDLNPSRAITELGWLPRHDQENSVTASLEWWNKVFVVNLPASQICREEIIRLVN